MSSRTKVTVNDAAVQKAMDSIARLVVDCRDRICTEVAESHGGQPQDSVQRELTARHTSPSFRPSPAWIEEVAGAISGHKPFPKWIPKTD